MKKEQTLLHVAAQKGDAEAVSHLIDKNVDLNAQDMVRTMGHGEIIPEIPKMFDDARMDEC